MKPAPLLGTLFLTLAPLSAAAAQTNPREASADAGADAQPKVEMLSDSEFRFGDILFRKDTKTIRFPAKINLDQDLLEYALVHESGKIHESLLSTEVSPYHLQIVLLLCGYQPGLGNLFDRFANNPATGDEPARTAPGAEKREKTEPDGLLVSVEWSSEDETKRARLEDWILSRATGEAMPRTPWSYTGSAIIDTIFQAEVEGSILAVYLDELALANHPGPGNDDDNLWIPHKEKMPPLDSSVVVIIEPAKTKSSKSE